MTGEKGIAMGYVKLLYGGETDKATANNRNNKGDTCICCCWCCEMGKGMPWTGTIRNVEHSMGGGELGWMCCNLWRL